MCRSSELRDIVEWNSMVCHRWLNVVIALDLSCKKYVGKLAEKTVYGGSRLWFIGICIV